MWFSPSLNPPPPAPIIYPNVLTNSTTCHSCPAVLETVSSVAHPGSASVVCIPTTPPTSSPPSPAAADPLVLTSSLCLPCTQLTSRAPTYFDNCASYSLAASLSDLKQPTLCTTPWTIGGVSAGLLITHQGYLKPIPGLQLSPAASLAYWGPGSHQTIISLGFLMTHGYSYVGTNRSLTVYNSSGSLIHTSPLAANNVHSPTINSSVTQRSILITPNSVRKPPGSVTFADTDQTPTPSPSLHPLKITARHIALCNEAESLHHGMQHPSDEALCQALDNGSIPNTTVTSAMVRLNRRLRGKCPHCLQGKLSAAPKPSSTKDPTLLLGHTQCLDIKKLPLDTISGKTQRIICVDAASGAIHFTLAQSKTTAGLLQPLITLFAEKFNAHGHTVKQINTDNEAVFRSLAGPLGTLGITMSLSAPGQHQGTAERATRTIEDRSRAVLASLPYQLPPHLAIYADYAVAAAHNNLPCSASQPHTPNELLTGMKAKGHHSHPRTTFGQSCMVQLLQAKRAAASSSDREILRVPKSELGVHLGPDPLTPGSSLFYLGTNTVVSSNRYEQVNITQPFDWKPQQALKASIVIPNQDLDVSLSPSPPQAFTPETITLLPQLAAHSTPQQQQQQQQHHLPLPQLQYQQQQQQQTDT